MDSFEIPAHLRAFVVRQDYDEYTEEDHAVWRFVVLQAFERLRETAHPAYEKGFLAAGITVDRIPKIDEMSHRLERFGFRAVCVDGFIPPRAFQAFQALGILPIAADIRSSKHLAYTPAPDIIHEAAGHAPFLAEPHYARYVRRIGAVAERAFSTRADRRLYEAIHALTEIKENPASTPADVQAAERAFVLAKESVGTPSEAALVARLFWWTAEYGLVGTPRDFRLYGAGLLSSLGESHFCHAPGVRKIPLTADCVNVDYDVTRVQPQLFVARSFSDLEDVLDDVEGRLAFRIGGAHALEKAVDSAEVATVVLDSGALLAGIVSKIHDDADGPSLVELEGPVAVGTGDTLLEALPRCARYALPLGVLEDGTPLSGLTPDSLNRFVDASGRLELRTTTGIVVTGRVRAIVPNEGRVSVVLFESVDMHRNGHAVFSSSSPFPLALGRSVRTAAAGAPAGYYPPTEPSRVTVPKPRSFGVAERETIRLFEAVKDARALNRPEALAALTRIADGLGERHEDAWLIRWNLLESLTKLGEHGGPAPRLRAELEALELRFDHLEPITTGLDYIRSLDESDRARAASAG